MATATAPKIDRGKQLRDYRVIRFTEMKFTAKEAEQLADATETDGTPVDHRTVRKAIENGCGHKLALRIFL